DVGMVTSYCPDGVAAYKLILESTANLRSVFYDMDTPVTLSRLEKGEAVPYVPAEGLEAFDLVLSYTGGEAIQRLKKELKARRVAPLYGWVDQRIHSRVPAYSEFLADLSYLGTFAQDRQVALETLLISAAREMPDKKFIIAGAMYQNRESWPNNIRYFSHLSPPQHSAFYSSSPLTLSVTRGAMAVMGYCPSGRLFEAAACGTAVLSDWWEGLDTFFEPGKEILTASTTNQAIAALMQDRRALEEIGSRAKQRALDCHTAEIRARRLIDLIETPVDESGAGAGLYEQSLVSRDA
ncbi:MAG: glycosyltransferase, partial [Acidobacteriota bacterium]|nr:glycosyltransferase [Acidobacteriota bacterium]